MCCTVGTLLILTILYDPCFPYPQEPGGLNADDVFESLSQSSLERAVAIFSQSVYVNMAQTEVTQNFVFSPLCLHSCLSLLYLGTTDGSKTEMELARAMGIIANKELIKSSYRNVVDTYKDQQSLMFGSHGWMDQSLNVTNDYRDIILDVFGHGLSQVDFADVNSAEDINKWISDLTNMKIAKLVDSLPASTTLFLANAIYFQENWLQPFNDIDARGEIVLEEFETESGKIKVPMMHKVSEYIRYGEMSYKRFKFEVVTVPYENQNFEMQFILPKSLKDFMILDNFMMLELMRDHQIDNENMFNIFSAPKYQSTQNIEEVNLKIPKFKVSTKFDAANSLKMMGVREAFGKEAELDKFVSGGPIAIGKVITEAVVEVTKNGTTAAGATGIGLVLLSASSGIQKTIILDRPFIFIVQDTVNNIPLLVGRVKNPVSP